LAMAEKYVSASWHLDQHSEVGDHLGQIYEKQGRKAEAQLAYAMAISGVRPEPEASTHLEALVGDKDKSTAYLDKNRDQLVAMRTFKLGKAPTTASAEWLLLLSNHGPGLSVEAVKFLDGDEKLKGFTDKVQSTAYGMTVPDESPSRIVRKGILSC